ncbi:MAG: flagellin lysine-N-methylase [Magnetococcales bacterium]|nr:flagellin lysine-N-methylase [Magnetococcales bacterium]
MFPDGQRCLSFRYMRHFQCIAGDCEDTCCQGWSVIVDRKSHDALQEALAGTPELLSRFDEPPVERLKVKDRRIHPEVHYAAFRMREDGLCVFFDEDRLCTLVRRFGDKLLGHDCATFPRRLHQVGAGRYELMGLCSCPEVVRLLLLSPEAAELDEITTDLLQKRTHFMHLTLSPEVGDNLYFRRVESVTAALMACMAMTVLPFARRMGLLLSLAERLDCCFSARGSGLSEERLDGVLSDLLASAEEEAQGLSAGKAACADDGGAVDSAFVLALMEKFMAADAPWAELLERREPEEAWRLHQQSRDFWTASHGARIDHYFTRFTQQALFSNKYTQVPRLGFYIKEWLIRCALLRTLLFAQPGLMAFQQRVLLGEEGGVRGAALLDREVVRVFHRFAKSTQHALEFLHERREWGLHDYWIESLTRHQLSWLQMI